MFNLLGYYWPAHCFCSSFCFGFFLWRIQDGVTSFFGLIFDTRHVLIHVIRQVSQRRGSLFQNLSKAKKFNSAVFNWVSKEISRLLWFCITTPCDWLTKLASLSQPIRIQTKTNRVFDLRFYDTQLETALMPSSYNALTGITKDPNVRKCVSTWYVACFRCFFLATFFCCSLRRKQQHSLMQTSMGEILSIKFEFLITLTQCN